MKHIKLFKDFLNEALRASKPNGVETVEVDMSYDDSDREEMKATQASWKKFNLKVKDLKNASFQLFGLKKYLVARSPSLKPNQFAATAYFLLNLSPLHVYLFLFSL